MRSEADWRPPPRGPAANRAKDGSCERGIMLAQQIVMTHPAITVSLTHCVAAAVVLTLGVLPGCYATLDDPPVVVHQAAPVAVGYAEVTSAPVDIETYPSVVYEGR